MSQVRVSQRKLSPVQFVDTARELLKHTFSNCKKLPKSAMFMITKDIADAAKEIYKNVIVANSIYPTKPIDIDLRYKHLMIAKGYIEVLDGLLSMAKDIYSTTITDYGWKHWGELMVKETNLIKGVIQSDKKI